MIMIRIVFFFNRIGNIISYTVKKGSAEGAPLADKGGCSGCKQPLFFAIGKARDQ